MLNLTLLLREFLTTFTFLASTHLLANVLPVLARLSKLFQRQCVDFAAISDGVEAAISAFDELWTKACKFLE